MESCLVCGKQATDRHHWPYTRRFGDATVPLCRECHHKAHMAHEDTIQALIDKAPGYWRSIGEWEAHQEDYECWLSKRKYRRETCVR